MSRRPNFRCTLAAVAMLASSSVQGEENAIIGVGIPLSGQFSAIGEMIRTGVERAVADINAKGGVKGRVLELVVADDSCDAEKAESAAAELVAAGAVIVVGHVCHTATRAAAKVYATAGVVQFATADQADELTDRRPGPGLFRLAPRADAEAKVIGAFLARRFADRAVAIAGDTTAYGQTLADAVKIAMNAAGKTESWQEEYSTGQLPVATMADRIRTDDVAAIFVGGYREDIASLARAIEELGHGAVVVAPETVADLDFPDLVGPGIDHVVFARPQLPANIGQIDNEAGAASIVARRYVLSAYAAVEIWVEAAAEVGMADLPQVAEAIQNGQFDTILGTVEFDEKGDWTAGQFALYRWRDGDIELVPETDE